MTIPTTDPALDVAATYDSLAEEYDDRYVSPACLAENRYVRTFIRQEMPAPATVLDIGAGTGLTLDLEIAQPDGYTAIDPSAGMLAVLREKFPSVQDVREEPFTDQTPTGTYDLIVALFGAASYLSPAALETIPGRLSPGGRAYLMTYREGYWPTYYATEPTTAPAAREAAFALGERSRLTNYEIVTVRA